MTKRWDEPEERVYFVASCASKGCIWESPKYDHEWEVESQCPICGNDVEIEKE